MRINGTLFNADLNEILDELVRQLRANGIPLIQKTKDGPTHIQVCCPYHNDGMERRPSAGIRKNDGKFHCFACNEVHELNEVITHCFGHDDDVLGKFGWNWLLKNFATVQVEERKDVILDFNRANVSRHSAGERDSSGISDRQQYVSEEELDSYRYIHPYMYKRRLTDEVIELFDIGYDKKLQSVTFPVRDIQGNCLFIARRSVNTKFFNYPAGAEKPLYGLYEYNRVKSQISKDFMFMRLPTDFLEWGSELIVCESMLDALTAWVYGKPAVALNGLGNELQFEQLRKLPCRKLILATDNDGAGMRARERIRKNVTNKIITEYMIPEGKKDLNDLSKEEFDAMEEIF